MPTRDRNADQTFHVWSSRDLQKLKFITKTVRESKRNTDDPWRQEDFWYTFHNAENLSLAFHRMLPHSDNRDEAKDKKKFLDALRDLASTLDFQPAKALFDRTEQILESVKDDGFEVEKFDLVTQWRMTIGLGSESVLETSMTLNPLYGFPYIPSSAVKGIARAYALYEENKACEEEDKKLNRDAKPDVEAQKVFGLLSAAGDVVFFDGVPDKFPELDVDIINVHYSDYYSRGEPPADWMVPVPSFFLTVKPGQLFHFYVASRSGDKKLAQAAVKWLSGGLTRLGIGAKSNAGYGYFVEPTPGRPSGTLKRTALADAHLASPAEDRSKSSSADITVSSRDIPAVVLDNSRKPILVKLLIPGYENQKFQCADVGDLAEFPPGKEILVDVRSYDITSKTIRMLGSPKLKK